MISPGPRLDKEKQRIDTGEGKMEMVIEQRMNRGGVRGGKAMGGAGTR